MKGREFQLRRLPVVGPAREEESRLLEQDSAHDGIVRIEAQVLRLPVEASVNRRLVDGFRVAHEAHLLGEPEGDRRIAAVEPAPHRLAQQHLVVDRAIDESAQIFGARLLARIASEVGPQSLDRARAHRDHGLRARADCALDAEEREPDQGEV